MQKTSRTALLTVALATAVGATALTTPASANHPNTGGGGAQGWASAQLRTVAQPLHTVDVCIEYDNQPVHPCEPVPIGLTADSIKLRLDYELARFETHLPSVETAAGILPAVMCNSKAAAGSPDKVGAVLHLAEVTFAKVNSLTINASGNSAGQTTKSVPVPPASTNVKSIRVTVCP